MSYCSLHCHTEYSNIRMLDSTNKLDTLIEKADSMGLNGIAITDHENVSGYIKAILKQKELQDRGSSLRIFLGDEIYLVDSLEDVRDNYKPKSQTRFFHFILIAKDVIGCKQIRQISSQAWKNSFYTGKMERTPTVKAELETIIGNDKGHIIASTACIGSEYAWWILQSRPDKCLEFIDWCQDVFLPENFYLEMQPNDCEEQVRVNQTTIKISEQLDIPYIITTDAHYLTADQAKVHEAYLNSRQDESRETLEFYKTCYLMTAEEIHEWMDKQIGAECVDIALENTNKIADQIEFYDLAHTQVVPKVTIPQFELGHVFKDYYHEYDYIQNFAYSENEYDRYFLYLIEQGYVSKEERNDSRSYGFEQILNRINLELEAIWESSININDNIASYYITALSIEDMMWDDANSLVGVSRGSITAFYTAYLIGLQQINPMEYDIPYWRHLHSSRPEMPDVDIDTCKSKRQAIIQATRDKFGEDKVLNICAFRTEGSKSAILTSARGLGIPNDVAEYIASLIASVRGFTYSLSTMVNGDPENDLKPNTEFINECGQYPGLLETASTIEGLICGRTVHASGVIIFDEPYTELNAMMKAPNGQPVTQWNMGDSEYAGGLKYDYLTIKNLDAMQKCLEYLVEYGYLEWQGSLKRTFNHYFHPDVLDYSSTEMWEMAERGEIINLFQFMTEVGKQAIQKIKPRSLIELCVANAVMRLMSAEVGAEQPLDTYVRYKNDPQQWEDCMDRYELTSNEKDIIRKYLAPMSGMSTMQEDVMRLSMDEHITNYSMKESNGLRKLIAKKKRALHRQAHDDFYKHGRELGTSDNLLDYVWKECITPQLEYSFSDPHIKGYSTIAVQEMNMAYRYPIIYWNCANLVIDSAADEDVKGATDYDKVGVAITRMRSEGVQIVHPLINEADFGFKPDEQNNRIIYAIKAINGIGDEDAETIIKNRPYASFEDFCEKNILTKQIQNSKMVKLIKSGAFDEFESDRNNLMRHYLQAYVFESATKLTLAQFNRLKEMNVIPSEYDLAVKMVTFKKYVLDDVALVEKHIDEGKKIPKCGYHDGYYVLDQNSQPFFEQHFTEDSVVDVRNGYFVVSSKKFTKEVDAKIQPLKEWFQSEQALKEYNESLFDILWDKHAYGTVEAWSMEALSFYDGKHELEGVDEEKYGVVNYFDLPEDPEPYDYWTQWINGEPKQIPKFKISRLAGTIIATDNNHSMISLLTVYGLVNVKMPRGTYSFYKRQISEKQEGSDKKTVIEKSWLKRGNKIIVCGIRRGDQFWLKNYKDTVYKHTINLVKEVCNDGTLNLQIERTKV